MKINSEVLYLTGMIGSVCAGGILLASGLGPYTTDIYKLAAGSGVWLGVFVKLAYDRMREKEDRQR